MNQDNEAHQPMDPKRRRRLLVIVLAAFVIWMGFMLSELRTPPPIPKASAEMRELQGRHLYFEMLDPMSHTGAPGHDDPLGEGGWF
jgi:hypothetical protein